MLYSEKYPVGTDIRIADIEKLQAFKRDWKYHHPLSDQQISDGGDVLYKLLRLWAHGMRSARTAQCKGAHYRILWALDSQESARYNLITSPEAKSVPRRK